MRAKGFVFALLVVLLSACGSDTKTEVLPSTGPGLDSRPAVRITQEFLLGTWTSNCALDPKRSGIYVKEYLQYDVDQVNRLATSYLDSACTASIYQSNLTSTYVFSSMGMYSETRKTVAILPLSSVGVNLFQGFQGYCGDRSWRLNEERTFRDVTACGIDQVVKLSLEAHDDRSYSELTATECEPRNPRNCTVMTYLRAH
jgi:hypothetical protein